MRRLLVLGVLAGLTVAEVGVVVAIYNLLGAVGTMLVLGLDMFFGILVIRWAARGPGLDRGWRIAGGVFIALPGLVLDLVGLALLFGPIRDFLKATLTRNAENALRRSGVSVVTVTDEDGVPHTSVVPGSVIVGEVIPEPPDSRMDRSQADEPRSGPRVIRGEIAPPESG